MKNKIKPVLFRSIAIAIPILVFICGCSEKKASYLSLDEILKKNESLNIVLDRYKNDSLKLKAAIFLIENLPYHYSYEGQAVDNYHRLYELHCTGKYTPEKVLDSISSIYGNFNYKNAIIKQDIQIKSEYLIDNIEWSFKVWKEQPWGKNIAFENFCEYILPYRIGDEKLIPWRKKIYEQFNPVLDSIRSLPQAEDPLFVAEFMLKHLKKRFPFYFSYIFQGPHVGPDIVNWYSGYCRESTDILIYVFRALGIPCGRDFIFVRGDDNTGHEWNFVLDKDGNSHYCSITYDSDKPEPVNIYWWSKGKTNRQTFSVNRKIVDEIGIDPVKIHPLFQYPKFKDVTHLYAGERGYPISIHQEKLYRNLPKNTPVYLCSSSWQDWIPLDCICYKNKKDSITFQKAEGGVVFRLATFENNMMKPLTDPFLLNRETGNIRYFGSEGENEQIVILHKFNLHWTYPWDMVGGVFEGSTDANFTTKDTLFVISNRPQRKWNILEIKNKNVYRYLRYVSPPKGSCNIAEVAFYSDYNDTIPIKGKPIGTRNPKELEETHNFNNVFDGDTKTSFTYHKPDSGWIGLKLKQPEKIRKIIYTARNRDNFINEGEIYELFYDRKGEWISVGKIEAVSDSLVYNVPKGALLYLRNHTQGKDERIFEYNERFYNIEQIFW